MERIRQRAVLPEPVEVTICIDKSAPTWRDKDGVADGYGIQIKENWFRSLLNTISFGYLYNDATLDIKIQANDKKADVVEVSGRFPCIAIMLRRFQIRRWHQ